MNYLGQKLGVGKRTMVASNYVEISGHHHVGISVTISLPPIGVILSCILGATSHIF